MYHLIAFCCKNDWDRTVLQDLLDRTVSDSDTSQSILPSENLSVNTLCLAVPSISSGAMMRLNITHYTLII